MSEHTPTPWYVERNEENGTCWITADHAGMGDIADLYHYNEICKNGVFAKQNAEANAEFIVEAVNNYERLRADNAMLVEALEPFAKYGDVLRGQQVDPSRTVVELWDHRITGQDLIDAHEALAKVKQ